MRPTSALGVYDGKVYDALWKGAQSEPLNQSEVPAAYEVCCRYLSVLDIPNLNFF
jgi:hypothetical protein